MIFCPIIDGSDFWASEISLKTPETRVENWTWMTLFVLVRFQLKTIFHGIVQDVN